MDSNHRARFRESCFTGSRLQPLAQRSVLVDSTQRNLTPMTRKYTKALLEPLVQSSFSVAEVMRKLGIQRWSGGTQNYITSCIKKFGIDLSHMCGKGNNHGLNHKGGPAKAPPSEILVTQPDGSRKTSTHRLRRALIELGTPFCCSLCALGPQWNDHALQLQVDHMNGNPLDHRPENLRFLCPNCHTQTPNFGAKNKRH